MSIEEWWERNGLSLVKELIHFQGKRFSVSRGYYEDLTEEQIIEMFDKLSLVKEVIVSKNEIIITANRISY